MNVEITVISHCSVLSSYWQAGFAVVSPVGIQQ